MAGVKKMEDFLSFSMLICLFLQLFSVGYSWKNLDLLDLGSNLLEGPLPAALCQMQNLKYLLLSDNKLTGEIPDCFGNMSMQLTVLDLRKNQFYGKIPTNFPKPNTLRNLGLNGNNLEGSLPRSLLNCKSLEVLDVGNNNLTDEFPDWLGTLPELSVLIIRNNHFHGIVDDDDKRSNSSSSSFRKLRILDISYNQFNGTLPEKMIASFEAMKKIDNQTQLKYMGDDTYYSDSVTLLIKGLEIEIKRVLTIFTTIDLSGNRFEGSIPRTIGELQALKVLNFSHNQFGGVIPPTIGDLSSLESLDLSWNHLEGHIPPQLAHVTSLGTLNLSQNRLVGQIPKGEQFNTFNITSFAGNPGLCGFPLPDCEPKKAPSNSVLDEKYHHGFMDGLTWESVLLGFASGLMIGLAMGGLIFYTNKPKWFHEIVEDIFSLSSKPKRREGLNWNRTWKR